MGRGESWAWPLAASQAAACQRPSPTPRLLSRPILALWAEFLTCALGSIVSGVLGPGRNHVSQTRPGSRLWALHLGPSRQP